MEHPPHQIPLDPAGRADDPKADAARDDGTHEAAPDIAYKRLAMVNVVFFGPSNAGDGNWVLIDAGMPKTASLIAEAAEERFGKNARPAAIILTHGHVDHVGALEDLAERWEVPIYAHPRETPYLNGTAAYPPPDPTVGGGIMPALSTLFPRGPFDVSRWLHTLPTDNSVPGMPGWKWLHTPGHTQGHVSLWREADRAMIVGDAFITTTQESAYAIAVQRTEMHGPPMYFTPDWASARESVRKLADLEPHLVVTGHGRAMEGGEMRNALHLLARDFDSIAVPEQGRYVATAAA